MVIAVNFQSMLLSINFVNTRATFKKSNFDHYHSSPTLVYEWFHWAIEYTTNQPRVDSTDRNERLVLLHC